jgi:hypothetical protein
MINCETCQSQLLHHLYGLLDAAERQALHNHLGFCPTCTAALEKARQQQQILAAAAKSEFPEVRFSAVPQAPTLSAPRLRARQQRGWGRWAVAACILILLGSSAGFAGLAWYRHGSDARHARAELENALLMQQRLKERLARDERAIHDEITHIQEQIKLVEDQFQQDLQKIQKTYENRKVQFNVQHPKALQAGAPNAIHIEAKTRDPKKAPPMKLFAQVVDEKGNAELLRCALKEGSNDVVLPPSLPLKPGSQLSLRVLVVEEHGPALIAGALAGNWSPFGADLTAMPAFLLAGEANQTLVYEMLPLVTSLYVTHLMTDRPMYRPGEVVHFRSLTLERFSLKPADQDFELHYRLVRTLGKQEQNVEVLEPGTGQPAHMTGLSKLKDANGQSLLGPDGQEIRGIGAGSFQLPADLGGGEYTLIVSEAQERFPAERRKILVNRYQAPRLYKDVDFTRKSYGPGDVVTANCKVAPVEGGRVLAKMPVTASAEVDGVKCELLTKGNLVTDDRGECAVQFKLPATIERGDGVVSVSFTDGGNIETTVEPIPIVLKKLRVEFFPEGGELIAGVANRVYFQVRTPLNKPAELTGRLVDKDGRDVVSIHTINDAKEIGVNQGLGYFDFTPVAGQTYELRVDTPAGIESKIRLDHPVQNDGVTLHAPLGVVSDAIGVVLQSGKKDRRLLVGAYCRGQLLDHKTVKVEAGKPLPVTLTPASGVGGVYRVTVFEITSDEDRPLKPVAERLLYRRSPEKLNLRVFTDKKGYIPGDKVMLSLSASDEHNRPAPAIVVVSVVDRSVLKLRNDRTARNMPTHFLLTSEVRGPEDLEYADFLLREEPRDPLGFDIAKAQVALDLLLGTQGWRRFVEQNLPQQRREVLQVYKDDAKRFFQVTGQDKVQDVKDPYVHVRADQTVNQYLPRHLDLQRALAIREAMEETQLAGDRLAISQQEGLLSLKQQAAAQADAAQADFMEKLGKYAKVAGALLLIAVSLLFVVIGVVRANTNKPNALAFLTLGALLFVLVPCVGLVALVNNLPRKAFAPASERIGSVPARGNDEVAMAPAAHDQAMARQQANAATAKMETHADKPRPEARVRGKLEGMPGGGEKGVLAEPKQAAGDDKGKGLALGKADPAAKFPDIQFRAPAAKPMAQPMPGLVAKDVARLDEFANGFREQALGRVLLVDEIERDLRKQGRFDKVAKDRFAKKERELGFDKDLAALKELPAIEPFLVREYAHRHETNVDGVRRDFAETIFWHPVLVLPGGKTVDVSFDLSDAVTKFEVQVWGHTPGGRLAAVTKDITSRLPFSLDAKLPIEISSTDKVAIPVTLTNDTDKNHLVKLTVETDKLKLKESGERVLPLNASQRVREILHLVPEASQGEAKLRLFGKCVPFGSDSVERTFKIVPEGFPVVGKVSDLLEKTATHTIQLPAKRDQWVPGTLKLQAQVFPSTLADLQKGLEALLREPGGCFEQTSSSNYPNIMILDYLKESGQVQPHIEKHARELLDRGYTKLIAFECVDPQTRAKKQGYEWFGQTAPPHEALTAYGLLEFVDMSRYQQVDAAMIERTKQYLLSQRNKKGGFLRNQRALDSFGRAPDYVTDAYIVWALSEADVKEDITPEIDTVVAKAEKSQDPYMLSLAALSLLKRGQNDRAVTLLKTLRTKQKADGSVPGAETSITRSGGTQLLIETTSLAILGWLRANQPGEFDENVRKGVTWIGQQRGGMGGYGSTQSTILALKALIAHTRANKKTAEAGEVLLYINDCPEPVAVKKFAAGTQDTLTVELPDEKLLQPGENTIRVEITGKNTFPHTLTWSYMAMTPANKDICHVRLATSLSTAKAKEGETVSLTAKLDNVSGKGQGMAVAILGLPAGLSLPTDLQELRNFVKAGKIDAFEVKGRELVLYWRELGDKADKASKEVTIHLICQIPGEYRGPASRAYLYYNADERWWVDPVGIAITPQ